MDRVYVYRLTPYNHSLIRDTFHVLARDLGHAFDFIYHYLGANFCPAEEFCGEELNDFPDDVLYAE